MRKWTVAGWAAALSAAVLAQACAAPASGPSGRIAGRLDLAVRPASGFIRFFVDGVQLRPTLNRNRFVLHRIPAGEHTFSVTDTGTNSAAYMHVRIRRGATTEVGTVRLAVGGEIAGTVTVGGQAAPRRTVFAEAVNDPTGEPLPLLAVTDRDGAYSLRGVPPGDYRVSAAGSAEQVVSVLVSRRAVADFPLP